MTQSGGKGGGPELRPPDDVPHAGNGEDEGDGTTFEVAANAAFEKAKHKRDYHRIKHIYFWGTNPISGYRVIVGA